MFRGFSDPRKEDWKRIAVLGPVWRQVPEGDQTSLYLPSLNGNQVENIGVRVGKTSLLKLGAHLVSQDTREPFGLLLPPDNGRKWQDLKAYCDESQKLLRTLQFVTAD